MKEWWLGLSARERIFVAGGGAVVSVLILFQFVLAPLLSWRAEAERRAAAAETDFNMVYRSASAARPPENQQADDTPIRIALNERAGALDIPITFVNAMPDGAVELQAGPAAPDAVFSLLSALENEHAVRIVAADITRVIDAPDTVRVQATLAR